MSDTQTIPTLYRSLKCEMAVRNHFQGILWLRSLKYFREIDGSGVEALSRLLASPSVTVLCPGAEYPARLAEATREANAVGNLVFDAQIVAVCRESGVSRLVTENRDFERFEGLHIEQLGR